MGLSLIPCNRSQHFSGIAFYRRFSTQIFCLNTLKCDGLMFQEIVPNFLSSLGAIPVHFDT